MNTNSNPQNPVESAGFCSSLVEGLNKTIPNALQHAVKEALHGVTCLSYMLDIKLPAHEDLYDYVAEHSPILPASLPPHIEEVLLGALQQLNATRQTLQTVWFTRAAEADGFWSNGSELTQQMPLEVWKNTAQHRKCTLKPLN